jgi:hypothetical protein
MILDTAAHLKRFYDLIDRLRAAGADRRLAETHGRLEWPQRGVYFFFEPGEERLNDPASPRVVRVGTHGLKAGSRSTLWRRLSQHRGPGHGRSGNHRGSIFRLLVGDALLGRDGAKHPTWGEGSSAPRNVRVREVDLEQRVSRVLGAMRVTWLDVPDDPSPGSLRGIIERNTLGLLSTGDGDSASPGWLGRHSSRERVRASGLWNQNHVGDAYDPSFLDTFDRLVNQQTGGTP